MLDSFDLYTESVAHGGRANHAWQDCDNARLVDYDQATFERMSQGRLTGRDKEVSS